MIIIRQKAFADQDYAGIDTSLKYKMIKWGRGMKAARLKKMHGREQARLNKELATVGDHPSANVVKQNMIAKYNQRQQAGRERINSTTPQAIITTKSNPTEIYQKNAAAKAAKIAASKPAVPAAGKKLGVGGKIGIAAAALGTTALAATAIKKSMDRRKEKQQQEAQAPYQQPQQ
jgi:hypothetical protein